MAFALAALQFDRHLSDLDRRRPEGFWGGQQCSRSTVTTTLPSTAWAAEVVSEGSAASAAWILSASIHLQASGGEGV